MKEILLTARDVCKTFETKKKEVLVLDHVSADICRGDFTVIMGPSGAGKSTLLYALSGMDGITSGKVIYKGRVISSLNEKQMADIRSREFGFVFQQTCLVSNLTLFENVAVAGYLGDRPAESEVRRRAGELLERMNVGDARDRLPTEVSGGEAQRAAMARAMINRPGLIFAEKYPGGAGASDRFIQGGAEHSDGDPRRARSGPGEQADLSGGRKNRKRAGAALLYALGGTGQGEPGQ